MPLGGAGNAASQAQQQENNRQNAINTGMATINQDFSTFTPDFYKKAATDYTDYATPQVMQQYQNTKNNLAYALARNGISNSSAAAGKGAALNTELSTNLNTVANQAQDQSNTLQSNVASQKTNVVNQLEASADPSAAASSAAGAVAGLQAPPAYQPIGNLFGDWTSTYLANMNAQAFSPTTPSIWSMLGGGGAT